MSLKEIIDEVLIETLTLNQLKPNHFLIQNKDQTLYREIKKMAQSFKQRFDETEEMKMKRKELSSFILNYGSGEALSGRFS
ncbi:UNKNOWN [Stylonychia lemnae]|uniref:Uncharacterized protein n=1 Tax=Stylonychia lemnae TaxID=5949 RepID=A0A077ZVD1_STYLE|nr:UNKNOWN [Stylonychia lemnae]|eukprot:CDW73255.1 UNKNOWN [Stylonychia lemnae]